MFSNKPNKLNLNVDKYDKLFGDELKKLDTLENYTILFYPKHIYF